jgi:Uma2 family endonuclease
MPDGAVATGTNDDNFRFHPLGKDVALVIEVADTTLNRDRGIKLRSYARAGIVCYWIVNLNDRQIEVYTDPDSAAEVPTYRKPQIFKPGDSVPLEIGGRIVANIAFDEILPTTHQ